FVLFDAVTGKTLGPLGTKRDIFAAAFSPDSRWLATAKWEVIEVWDTATLERVATLSRPPLIEKDTGAVVCMTFSPDGKSLLTGHTDKVLTRWDWKAGIMRGHLRGHQGWVSRVAFFPDGDRIVSGSWDGTTKIWEVASGKLQRTVAEEFVALSPDGKMLA